MSSKPLNPENVSKLQLEMATNKKELSSITEQIKTLNARKRVLDKRNVAIQEELKLLNDTSTASAHFESDSFKWSSEMESKLKSIFKIDEFRSYQKAAINATMSKVDLLLIMPTGGGKSLCFQLPALLSPGITLVISPLISLMEDQLRAMKELSIPTAIINAQTPKEETKSIFEAMIADESKLKILYVTPEKLAKSKRLMSQIEKMYKRGKFSRLVIDEVHCVSTCGHDFRPDYKFLGIMKKQYPETPIIGLTATATNEVILDIQKILNLENCLVFKDSFFRPNLQYEVYDVSPEKNRIEDIASIINVRFPKLSGIIYCLTIKDVEEVASKLKAKGIESAAYHAQLDPGVRQLVQKNWYEGKIHVIVATVAFGMGINKLDVRFVIHHSISKSLENFYQESGRAGRDGLKGYCILFFSFSDIFRATSLMMTEKYGTRNVYNMLKYCIDRITCRKALIANHFGDSWDYADDACQEFCDNCKMKNSGTVINSKNVTPLLKDVLQILEHGESSEERMTALKLMNAWYKKGGDKKLRLDSVSVPQFSRVLVEGFVAQFILDGFIGEEFHFTPYSTISHLVVGVRKLRDAEEVNCFVPTEPRNSKPYLLKEDRVSSIPIPVTKFSSTSTSHQSNKKKSCTPSSKRTPFQAGNISNIHQSSNAVSSFTATTTIEKPKKFHFVKHPKTNSESEITEPPSKRLKQDIIFID